MLWFLRLFAAFRSVLMERARLEAEVETLREALDVERTRTRELQEELIGTLKRTVDSLARQATGRNVFERASAPVEADATESAPRPIQKPVVRQRAQNHAAIDTWLNEQRRKADEAVASLSVPAAG